LNENKIFYDGLGVIVILNDKPSLRWICPAYCLGALGGLTHLWYGEQKNLIYCDLLQITED
jgi:hypothetical protein